MGYSVVVLFCGEYLPFDAFYPGFLAFLCGIVCYFWQKENRESSRKIIGKKWFGKLNVKKLLEKYQQDEQA